MTPAPQRVLSGKPKDRPGPPLLWPLPKVPTAMRVQPTAAAGKVWCATAPRGMRPEAALPVARLVQGGAHRRLLQRQSRPLRIAHHWSRCSIVAEQIAPAGLLPNRRRHERRRRRILVRRSHRLPRPMRRSDATRRIVAPCAKKMWTEEGWSLLFLAFEVETPDRHSKAQRTASPRHPHTHHRTTRALLQVRVTTSHTNAVGGR